MIDVNETLSNKIDDVLCSLGIRINPWPERIEENAAI